MQRRPDLSKAITRAASTDAAELLLSTQSFDRSLIPLEKITSRPSGDTRPLNHKHVQELVNSITVLGLISPLTVDRHYRLLAGAHRKAAIEALAESYHERFLELFGEGVPVCIMDLDAERDPVDALQVEVEENTQRRNYTVQEIREAAKKLEEAGYQRLRGRPGSEQKSLNRELMNVFRLSRRRISDILNEPPKKSAHECALFDELVRYMKQSENFYNRISQVESTEEILKVQRDTKRLLKNLRLAIKAQEGKRSE
ncbi:MAG TPA: ParB/RepB/Spo0J family partition protein [Stenomitos sp.]